MKRLKRFSALLLATLSALSLTACDSLINSTKNVDTAAAAATTTDALAIDNAVDTYYTGIISGSINNENKPTSLSNYVLPSQTASSAERKNYAKYHAALKEAMMYSGIWDTLQTSVTGGSFGYADGGIVSALDDNGNIISITDSGSAITQITSGDITLGTISASGS